jgi:perosamine synthetase
MDFRLSESNNIPSTDVLGTYGLATQLRKVFTFYKRSKSNTQLMTSVIELEGNFNEKYLMVPLSQIHLEDLELTQKLCDFRNSFISIYPDSTIATLDSTKNWMNGSVVNNEDRILFLVVDTSGKIHGHLGIWYRNELTVELDNVLKSKDSNIPGLFSAAVEALEKWINEVINLSEISLRVLESNEHAVKFYQKLGYKSKSREEMMWISSAEGKNLVSAIDGKSNEAWLVMVKSLEESVFEHDVIPTAGPSITAFEIAYVNDAVRTGWNSHHSDYLTTFSKVFGDYVGARYVIPTDSCTSALHLGLWALGVGPGDEVIVPDLTWVATANAVRYLGAKPVFADIDPATWCIDPKSVESLITSKTKVILPVHLYGFVANIQALEEIASKHNLFLLQDAAPGIGSSFGGKGVAEFGDFTAFSFQGAKLLVSGEGGALTTNNKELFEKAYKIADVGRRPGTFWIEEFGKKIKMSNLTAALALGQMQSVERQIEKKRRIQDWYHEGLSSLGKVKFQVEQNGTRSIAWMTSINISEYGIDRDGLRKELLKRGVDTRPVFPAISTYPIWDKTYLGSEISNSVGANSINLPSGVRLNKKSVDFICQQVIRSIESN